MQGDSFKIGKIIKMVTGHFELTVRQRTASGSITIIPLFNIFQRILPEKIQTL